ncbi:MAG: sigma-70 family RNA polymerase sigma factor [Acidobacteriota bacterium]
METETEFRQGTEKEQDFQRLFDRFYQPVARFFSNRGFDRDRALDLAQETFIGVYRGVDSFRHESSEETWLFRIATNIWRNELRSRSADKRSADETSLEALLEVGHEPSGADDDRDDSALDGVLEQERARLLLEAIDELPAQMRRCIQLRVGQDMKYREIADTMQISIQTVKSQLFQARSRLRDRLGEYFEGWE